MIYKPAKTWIQCKRLSFKHWGGECLYSRKYIYIVKPHWSGLLSKIDPAHVFGRGSSPHMAFIPANVIPLCRYIHSLIDQNIDPQTGKPMTEGQREEILRSLVGDEVYNRLEEIKRSFYNG